MLFMIEKPKRGRPTKAALRQREYRSRKAAGLKRVPPLTTPADELALYQARMGIGPEDSRALALVLEEMLAEAIKNSL